MPKPRKHLNISSPSMPPPIIIASHAVFGEAFSVDSIHFLARITNTDGSGLKTGSLR